MTEPVLRLNNISTVFQSDDGPVAVVDDVSFELLPGEMFGIVGESGVGKTTLALSLLGLIKPPARVTGEVWYRGRELLSQPERVWRRLLGNEIAFIPSSGKAALNPVFTVGRQLT
jgi:peptide/nickel transport system ATP-binding protein